MKVSKALLDRLWLSTASPASIWFSNFNDCICAIRSSLNSVRDLSCEFMGHSNSLGEGKPAMIKSPFDREFTFTTQVRVVLGNILKWRCRRTQSKRKPRRRIGGGARTKLRLCAVPAHPTTLCTAHSEQQTQTR